MGRKRKYVDTPDWALDALYNREWRKRHNICEGCGKGTKMEGISRCVDCQFPEMMSRGADALEDLSVEECQALVAKSRKLHPRAHPRVEGRAPARPKR